MMRRVLQQELEHSKSFVWLLYVLHHLRFISICHIQQNVCGNPKTHQCKATGQSCKLKPFDST